MEGDRFVLRSITEEIMYELMQLSGQEYVDVYASAMKARIAEARRAEAVKAKAAPCPRPAPAPTTTSSATTLPRPGRSPRVLTSATHEGGGTGRTNGARPPGLGGDALHRGVLVDVVEPAVVKRRWVSPSLASGAAGAGRWSR